MTPAAKDPLSSLASGPLSGGEENPRDQAWIGGQEASRFKYTSKLSVCGRRTPPPRGHGGGGVGLVPPPQREAGRLSPAEEDLVLVCWGRCFVFADSRGPRNSSSGAPPQLLSHAGRGRFGARSGICSWGPSSEDTPPLVCQKGGNPCLQTPASGHPTPGFLPDTCLG